jgi:signal transduction histidine kinase
LGAINIGSDQPDAFDSIILDILQEVAILISLRLQQSLGNQAQREATFNLEALVDLRTAELQEMIEQLAKVNKQKNKFMAAVSHELRTPLNAILGKAENLQEEGYGALTTKQHQATQVIIDNSYKLLTLINNILDISHLEADRLSLYLKEVDVVVICHEIMVRIQQIAHTQKIRVIKNIPTKQILMTIDEDRFRQILFNLLDNAIKFNHAGGEIGLDILEDKVEHCVHFVVWDTGIGISPDMIDFIFMLFTQVDGRLARKYEGTGLGLPLAYRLTQLHDGQLTVTSEVDKGSRFTVTLPIAFTTIETAV